MGQSAHTTINIPVHGPPTELENILAHTTINIPVHGPPTELENILSYTDTDTLSASCTKRLREECDEVQTNHIQIMCDDSNVHLTECSQCGPESSRGSGAGPEVSSDSN